MRRNYSVSGALLLFVLSGCGRDAPTEPKSLPTAPRAALTAVATSGCTESLVAPDEVAGLAAAIEDVRTRILPTLGDRAAVQALASAFDELERALPHAATVMRSQEGVDPSPDSQPLLDRADAAAAELEGEGSLLPDLDVVRLVLERADAIAHGRAEPAQSGPAWAAGEKPGAAGRSATPCAADTKVAAGDRREQ